MSERDRANEAGAEGATGMVGEEGRALTESEATDDRATDSQGGQTGERTIGDDEAVNRGERDLTSE